MSCFWRYLFRAFSIPLSENPDYCLFRLALNLNSLSAWASASLSLQCAPLPELPVMSAARLIVPRVRILCALTVASTLVSM